MEIGTLEGKPKTFSADVLRLELTGPSQPHFSVIDVPGIFKKVTAGVTTKEDMAMVAGMVRGYMENHRSVILAVIPANVDIATQEILDSAEELDPDGIRTLGILTKPDLVDKGAEPAVMDIVQGRSHSLQLGWHLLKNPGQAKLVNSPSERRMLEEDFFSKQTPWNSLERDRVGVGALKARLQEILADHIRREFPKVCHITQHFRKLTTVSGQNRAQQQAKESRGRPSRSRTQASDSLRTQRIHDGHGC